MNKNNTTIQLIAVAVMGLCIVLLVVGTVFLCVSGMAGGDSSSSEVTDNAFKENADSYYEGIEGTYGYKDVQSTQKTSNSKTESSIEGDTVEAAQDSTSSSSTDMPDSDFIFPDSQTTLITTSQMEEKLTTKERVHRAINEIYARHGYNFKKTDKEYFYSLSWYQNLTKIDDMDTVEAQFSSIEKQNVDNLAAYRSSKGWD